ncbi:MAG: glycosyl hydrolase, partial [Opitutales bacterium]
MKLLFVLTFILSITLLPSRAEESLEGQFASPSAEARPWVFWHWTNGNVTREGITKDLEAMRDVGIGGVITFRLSGPAWAPPGPLKTGMENQLPMIRYAAEEADRLGLHFSLVIDYGYGSGGPHITPELSMQRLYQSETTVQGGRMVRVKLPKPSLKETMNMELKKAWLRPGASIKPEVLNDIKNVDSYKDIAVFAVPASSKASIKKLDSFTGLDVKTAPPEFESGRDALPGGACIDLSAAVNEDGELNWQAPPGNWTVIRLGYGSNFKLTRPSPAPELGLEADRIHPRGLDRHFDHRLKPVLEALNKDGTLIDSIFIDSWEAGSQNWTLNFAETFKELRGYELQPWLPALTGRVVESADKTERFLWDFRQTISEQMLTHYIDRLEARLEPYGIESFYEPYGHMCADPLVWAGRGTFPVAEFWSAP